MKKILIVGGTGRLATFTIKELLSGNEKIKIYSFSRGKDKSNSGFKEVEYFFSTEHDSMELDKFIANNQFDIILFTPNLLTQAISFKNLITIVRAKNIPIIFIGSAAIFTKIPNAKTRGLRTEREELIRTSGIRYAIVRPTMIYGHVRDNNIYKLKSFVEKYPFVITPSGADTKHSPVLIHDLAKLISLLILKVDIDNIEVNCAGPELISFKEMIYKIKGKRIPIIQIPSSAVKFVLNNVRKMGFKAWHPEKIDRFNENKIEDESEKMFVDFGFHLTSFEEGIKKYDP